MIYLIINTWNVTKIILSEIDIKNYFNNTIEKRIKLQKATLTILKKSLKTRALVSDTEIKAFVIVHQKKNEESENYEFAAILRDISNNFDAVNELTKTTPRRSKTIKTDKTNNE